MPGVRARVRETLAPGSICQKPMLAPPAFLEKTDRSLLEDCIVEAAMVLIWEWEV